MFDDIQDAVEAVHSGEAILLDVRTLDEHQQGSAHGALHFDAYEIMDGADPGLEKDARIVIYCRSGGRANAVCTILADRGYQNLQNVGGLTHWLAAGGRPAQK